MKSIDEREIVAQMGHSLLKAAAVGAKYMGIAGCTAPKFSYPYLSAVTGKTLGNFACTLMRSLMCSEDGGTRHW
jgi:hypothetical protein